MAHFSTRRSHIITLPGGGQISPTPDLAGETTAFPIFLI
jgi:hypothetical protein